jgi:hypothetical protein
MLRYDSVGDEDLLLGILRADEGVAVEALSSLEVTLDTARGESEEMLSNTLSSVGMPLEKVRRCRKLSPNIFRALSWWQEGRIVYRSGKWTGPRSKKEIGAKARLLREEVAENVTLRGSYTQPKTKAGTQSPRGPIHRRSPMYRTRSTVRLE